MIIGFQITAIGTIGIAEKRGEICAVYFESERVPAEAETARSPLVSEAFRQLEAYFSGHLKVFELPLAPEGTAFQRRVWSVLETIPYGATASYKEVAGQVGKPKATRAVGLANNRNPIPIFIPCHRVIGADGSLVGYGGGLEIKRFLLGLEARHV